jgi:DUF4097 and DUF4098 domain-containing protein YvlB
MLTVRNFNGPIEVRPSSGASAELRAEKRTSRGGRLTDVAFEVRTSSNGDVSICSTQHDDDSCDSDRRRGWRNDGDRRTPTVAMTLLVPKGIRLKVATGNGALTVEGAGGEVEASTGNGRVRVVGNEGTLRVSTGNGEVDVRDAKAPVRASTGNGNVTVATADGPVNVSTGNGDIDVTMNSLRAAESMGFSTGSGRVRLTLPANYNGELEASTGNGEIRSDFDLMIKGQLNPRRIRATIGSGGPLLRLSSGNGDFHIAKGR